LLGSPSIGPLLHNKPCAGIWATFLVIHSAQFFHSNSSSLLDEQGLEGLSGQRTWHMQRSWRTEVKLRKKTRPGHAGSLTNASN
jgi:hypothetical protein